jgi:hypothetical protein
MLIAHRLLVLLLLTFTQLIIIGLLDPSMVMMMKCDLEL